MFPPTFIPSWTFGALWPQRAEAVLLDEGVPWQSCYEAVSPIPKP